MCRVSLSLVIALPMLSFFEALAQNHSMSATAQAYLKHAIDVMQQNALHSEKIDWRTLRREALERARGAEVPVDTYDAIRWALKRVNKHSFLQLSPELEKQEAERKMHATAIEKPVGATTYQKPASPFASRDKIEGRMLELSGRIDAYIVVPHFSPRNEADGVRFETELQHLIGKLDRDHPHGWIIDLRGNDGGNMWPMLAGLGPLLGEGVCGAFHNAGGTKMSWFYRGGKAGYEGPENWSYPKVADMPYQMQGNPKIAVLIDSETASSGEATAIAFRGRAHTRFFGEHTMGVSTNNTNFLLPDGANMILTVGVLVDRDGDEYEEGLPPDVMTPSPTEIVPLEKDETVKTAEQWLSVRVDRRQ
jgi:C-terminal processing protease CtpA/Prc